MRRDTIGADIAVAFGPDIFDGIARIEQAVLTDDPVPGVVIVGDRDVGLRLCHIVRGYLLRAVIVDLG